MLPFQIPLPLTDPIVIFAVVSCLMLVVPFLMEKIRMPGLVGLLLAGAVLGPNAFHVLERDESFVLFGNVGLIFIMFTAALEVDLSVFKKFGLHALVFGVLTFGLPQGPGTPAAHYLLQYDLAGGGADGQHLRLAHAAVVSRGQPLGHHQEPRRHHSGGRHHDHGRGRADGAGRGGRHVHGRGERGLLGAPRHLPLGLRAVIFVGLPILGRFLFRRMGEDGVAQFSFVLASVFVCAALAHSAGVEPIVGAFFAGLALNRLIPHNGALMNRIQFTGEAIFVPFFLLSVGMLLDARVLFSGTHTWVLIGFMTGMVVVTKFLAAESTRLFLRFDKAEARVVYGLSVPQAAATLAAVMIGFDLGLFDSAVVNATIVMILVTCTLGPWVTQRYGPAVAEREAALEAQAQVGPKQRILVGLQGLLNAQSVIEVGLMLRDGAHREPLHLVHAACDDDSLADTVARGENMLHDAVTLCSAADVPAKTATSVDHTVGEALVRSNKAVQSSHLLLDWDFAASDNPDSVLGTELDVLVAGVTSTLVLMRNRHPLGTNQKVTFAIPTGGVSAEELEAAAATVKRLANQLGAPVEVLAEQVTWDAIASVLEAAKPSAKLSHKLLESWASLNQALADLTSTSDLLVLMGTRDMDHEAARTPITVVERFPEASVFAIYGAVPEPLLLA
jgi:Kef-type K+ transport system membrane component KefB